MSQLQIGLISLGALIILSVLLFNWWQERNIKREMVRRFEGPIDDVLMNELHGEYAPEAVEDFRIDHEAILEIREEITIVDAVVEPQAGMKEEEPAVPHWMETEPGPAPLMEAPMASEESAAVAESAPPEAETVVDDIPAEPIRLSEPEPKAVVAAELPWDADPHIDEIAIITPNQACTGSTIRDALQPLPAFQKPVRWVGLDSSGVWQLLTKEQEQSTFTRIVGTLQLADRSGPANGEDLRNFHAKVEDLAVRVGGTPEWREHSDPLQYARELDQFCIEVDVMISLQLAASGGAPFAGTKLRGVAEAAGLTLKEDGQFHYINDAGEDLFVLACLDRRALTPDVLRTILLRGVVLMMDVPRVGNGAEVFNHMVLLGRKLETALSARLMDENQHPLGDAEIEKIRHQLKAIYSKMVARGIIPGSTSALRLFS